MEAKGEGINDGINDGISEGIKDVSSRHALIVKAIRDNPVITQVQLAL